MYIVHVHIDVKTEFIESFLDVCRENARYSINEPGIARFDVIQQIDNPTHFELIEVYRTSSDSAKHKETAHYNKWRELAEPMLAKPRTRTIYSNIFPEDVDW